jgi:hypothetical protein
VKASAKAAIGVVAVSVAALLALSGGSTENPRTPAALPGLPAPFLTTAVLGNGGLSAGIDAYGDIVDLRDGPGGRAMIDNSYRRQVAGTVPAATGVLPMVSAPGERLRPLWEADSVVQHYRPATNVLRTTAAIAAATATFECAVTTGELGCVTSVGGTGPPLGVGFGRHLEAGADRVHLDDGVAARIVFRAAHSDRAWLARARPLGPDAPAWARRMYGRSLLVLRSATDRRTGAVVAGARDGWAYVWPRDAGATILALAAAGYRHEAGLAAAFLSRLDLEAAARFDAAGGAPVEGREAQGDAAGWTLAAIEAAGIRLTAARRRLISDYAWRERADYQERSPGQYVGNALAGGTPLGRSELTRSIDEPDSGADSAAAWAVRPFPQPPLFAAAIRSLQPLLAQAGRFGIVPSEDWGERDPWSAPTAWSAWSLAALGHRGAALALLADLRRAATPAGLLPERVDADTGVPRSTTPLTWSHAFTVLALRELWPGSVLKAPAPRRSPPREKQRTPGPSGRTRSSF